jgi:hypothetical protein
MSTLGRLTLLTCNTFPTTFSPVPSNSLQKACVKATVLLAQSINLQHEAPIVYTQALKCVTLKACRLSTGTTEQLDSLATMRYSKHMIGVVIMVRCTRPTLGLQSRAIPLLMYGGSTGSLVFGHATWIDLPDHRIFKRQIQTANSLHQKLDLLSLSLLFSEQLDQTDIHQERVKNFEEMHARDSRSHASGGVENAESQSSRMQDIIRQFDFVRRSSGKRAKFRESVKQWLKIEQDHIL